MINAKREGKRAKERKREERKEGEERKKGEEAEKGGETKVELIRQERGERERETK